jgi:hypothetical protein
MDTKLKQKKESAPTDADTRESLNGHQKGKKRLAAT